MNKIVKILICILVLLLFSYSCCNIKLLCQDTRIFSVNELDSLPSFCYQGIERNLQPNVQIRNSNTVFVIDSLLSVYLEEKILLQCSYCEGIFRYKLSLKIDENGYIIDVLFIKDNVQHLPLNEIIDNSLKELKLKPAIKNGETVITIVEVVVKIDTYFHPFKMRKEILKNSDSR
jgi:hypothetical protein